MSPAPGKTFGSIPPSTKRAKVSRISRALVEPPGREAQTGQRDHRVAAPIAEPWIAGDDRATIRYFGERPGETVNVGSEHQPQHPARRISVDRVGGDRLLQYRAVVVLAAFQRGDEIALGSAARLAA